MSKWIDARKTPPPDQGEIPALYLVILDTKSPAQHCKTWAGMGVPEFASYYKGWRYPWNARGSLEVAYWMEPPKFDMRWQMNEDGTPGEWVPNAELRGASRLHGEASLSNDWFGVLPAPTFEKENDMHELPDGSGFFVGSLPLPKDHWLYAPNCAEWDSERDTSADTPRPILDNSQREAVKAAVRWAVRGATMNGTEPDFDPDALVLNAAYALCGPCGLVTPNVK